MRVRFFFIAKRRGIFYDSFMKTITLSRNSIHRSLWRYGLLLIPLLLVCFAFLPRAQAVGPDTDGSIPGSNNGEGVGVLVSRTTGIWNTGTGFEALNHLTAGNQNTATGLRALNSDINGGFNTATGVYSLFSNTSGFFNSATGAYSLANNTASRNTANGYAALFLNTQGDRNTATGSAALYKNRTGTENTAAGFLALYNNITGNYNTANGGAALLSNTTGSDNTALGDSAGYSITGDGNVCIGSGVTGSAGVDNTTWIRNVYSSVAGERAVYVNVDNKIGTLASSRRFKEEIKSMDKGSEVLFALKPVSFRYKKEFDARRAPMFGLIAEDVEQVDPDLVSRNEKGEVETVRYEQINAMLLNEFLKEHRKVEQLEKQVEALTVGLQKVSAQLGASKPAPQVAENHR
jgi:hypothetical protein